MSWTLPSPVESHWEKRSPWRPERWHSGSRPNSETSPCRTQTEGFSWCWPRSAGANCDGKTITRKEKNRYFRFPHHKHISTDYFKWRLFLLYKELWMTQPYLLVFQMCSTSGSVIFMFSAWASRKSKKYLTACGALQFGIPQIDLNRFSTYECTATLKRNNKVVSFSAVPPTDFQINCMLDYLCFSSWKKMVETDTFMVSYSDCMLPKLMWPTISSCCCSAAKGMRPVAEEACHLNYSYRNITAAGSKNNHVRNCFWYQFCWCWYMFYVNEALWVLLPLALVESSLVRCTSFSFNFFLSGFFLWSSSTSGSICRKGP